LNEVDLLVTDLSNLLTTSEFPVDRIRVLLINFDAVTESQEFTWLQALRGFAGTRGALTELIKPAFSGEPTTTEPLTDSINESDSDLGVEELPAPLPQSIQTIRTLKPYRGEA
jgi:hypothetical protein